MDEYDYGALVEFYLEGKAESTRRKPCLKWATIYMKSLFVPHGEHIMLPLKISFQCKLYLEVLAAY
jgi:hypothetical protein